MKLNKILAGAVALASLSMSASVYADSTQDLIDALITKGVLSEDEGALLAKGNKADKKKLDEKIGKSFPIKLSHTKKGFRFETEDGKFQTNLLWRAQMRFTTPDNGDPRQLSDFNGASQNTFEARRLRMKIGGHAYEPWLKYYFEVDLQPTRDVDDSSSSASARVIDWRIDVAKYDKATLRLGQWKINYNRERVDSSGKQQFVERSIANEVFTVDRQVGAQLTGRLFKETPMDINYWAGVYTGEGRGVENPDNNLMTMARVQWNPNGRSLKWQQTDVDFTEKPTSSISFAMASNTGACTKWSSSGCGYLAGFTDPSDASPGTYKVNQWTQGSAFKYRGFSWQQEYHDKEVTDEATGITYDFDGGYAQAGYFFHYLMPSVPKELELAARYARVNEPNPGAITFENEREEFTMGANWFLFGAGHNNKITTDVSRLTLDDSSGESADETRFRVQWDVTF